ncbi:hypothetical protein [uncultured Methylobacterium sp.]|jgi:hypothetical protein|uniref:hypothetical protein n=1 Tax=uncultured Methylobacterium sp. TaxID=157278 RepID=UPI00260A115E|nr:hypothetical protein [uncultured Methylobacterium sp.]
MASRKMTAQEREWRAQDDLRTLTQAAQIQGDRSRLSAVQKHAAEQVRSLNKVAGKTAAGPRKRGK